MGPGHSGADAAIHGVVRWRAYDLIHDRALLRDPGENGFMDKR
jgi:hypothetical protein